MAETTESPELGAFVIGDEHEVTAASVRDFVLATNDSVERYEARQVAPPVYATVAALTAHSRLIVSLVPTQVLLGAVHLGQTMQFERLLRAGEVVTSRATLVESRTGAFGSSICMLVEVWGDDGGLAAQSWHRVLFRGTKGTSVGETMPMPRGPRRHDPTDDRGEVTYDIAADQSLRYASASGDLLPIHTDIGVARAAGFPELILHGMATIAMCGTAVIDLAADGDPTRLAEVSATFVEPVIVGRPLVVSVEQAGAVIGLAARQGGRPVTRYGCARLGTA